MRDIATRALIEINDTFVKFEGKEPSQTLLAAVSVGEMTLRAKQITAVTYNQSPYIVAAIFYLLVTIPLGRLVARLENRLAVQDSGVGGKRPPRVGAEAVDSEHVIAHSERDMVRVGER